jgi:hypothetical protein
MTPRICEICGMPATHREQVGFPRPYERLLCQWHSTQEVADDSLDNPLEGLDSGHEIGEDNHRK